MNVPKLQVRLKCISSKMSFYKTLNDVKPVSIILLSSLRPSLSLSLPLAPSPYVLSLLLHLFFSFVLIYFIQDVEAAIAASEELQKSRKLLKVLEVQHPPSPPLPPHSSLLPSPLPLSLLSLSSPLFSLLPSLKTVINFILL